MSIYDKRNFNDVLSDIFNQDILGENKKSQKKSNEKYLTFVIQEEEGGFVKSIERALKFLKQKDFKASLMYLDQALESQDKTDFEGLKELTSMFSNFDSRSLKEIFLLISKIKSLLKQKTESLLAREFYFEESETFGKNISAAIKSILSNDFNRTKKSLESSFMQISGGSKDDFNIQKFNDLITLIKIIDKVNRLKIVDFIDFINYEVKNLIDVLKSYKKVKDSDKDILKELERMVSQIESRGIKNYLYEALKNHVNRLLKSQTDNSVNTKILNKTIKGFKSFLIQKSMVHRI